MRNIPPLYHWSPRENREAILRDGLIPTTQTHNGVLCVCLGVDPVTARALLPQRPAGLLDLYQVHVADTPVFRKQHWGRIAEYRIPRVIKPSGIIWLAVRGEEL